MQAKSGHETSKHLWAVAGAVAFVCLALVAASLVAARSQGAGEERHEYLAVVVKKNGLTFTASSPNAEVASWKYRVIDTGEACNKDQFSNAAPNHPAIHRSDRLTIPENGGAQDAYRNRWLCFEAVSVDGHKFYGLHDIDLGKPVVSIRRVTEGGTTYLRAYADEDVTYRIGWGKRGIVSPGDGGPLYAGYAGSLCEQVFRGPPDAWRRAVGSFEEMTQETDRIRIEVSSDEPDPYEIGADVVMYCFEATDADGNKTYVYVEGGFVGIRARFIYSDLPSKSPFYDLAHADPVLLGSSSDIAWTVSGPSYSAACNAGTLTDQNPDPRFSYREVRMVRTFGIPYTPSPEIIWSSENSQGRYHYCIRAVDQLGFRHYKALTVDY
ncbi:hypothetical protein F4X86_04465 [Candidatus Saccharibacteria bacterium]|nr:hypothetical protein [Candidatus Saccharibacteria bacterium]